MKTKFDYSKQLTTRQQNRMTKEEKLAYLKEKSRLGYKETSEDRQLHFSTFETFEELLAHW